MSKRPADESAPVAAGGPPIKKVHFEPHLMGPISNLEDMDIKVLQFQNKKLAQVRPIYANSLHVLRITHPRSSELNNASARKRNCGSESSSWRSDKRRTTRC